MSDNAISSNSPKRGVGAQAILLAGATGIAQLITALIFVIAARSTDPAQFGTVVAAMALGTSFVGFVDFGTNGYWVRELARKKLNVEEFGQRLTTKVLVAGIISILLGGASYVIAPESNYWMAAPVGFALFVNQSAQVPLRGMARTELISFSVLLDRTIAFGILVLLIAIGFDAYSSLWMCLTVGSLSAAVLGWRLTPAAMRPVLKLNLRANPWRGAGFYGLSTAAVSAQTLDLPLLALSGGPLAAGLYGAVNRWTQPLGLLVTAFASASAPFVARSGSWGEAWLHVRKALWVPLAAIVGCIVVAAFAPLAVRFLLGNAYEDSATVLRILALAMVPVIVNQPLAGFLQSMGHDKGVSVIIMISVVAQLASVFVLGMLLGAVGAAIGFAILQLAIMVSLLIFTRWAARHRLTRP